MTVFVSIDTKTGQLNRYEIGGNKPRLTHTAHPDNLALVKNYTQGLVDAFRDHPDPMFRVQPQVKLLPGVPPGTE